MNSADSGSTKRIVILGHGALGTLIGVALQRAGHRVVFIGRASDDTGETLPQYVNYGEFGRPTQHVQIDVVRDPSVVTNADLVIVLVKTPDTVDAIERVAPFLPPGIPLLTLQNGLHAADRIRDVLNNKACVIPGVTSQAATRTGSNSVAHMGKGPTWIGFDDPRSELVANWIALLLTGAGIPTSVVDSVEHVIWQKVAVNAAINGITALCGTTNGAIADDPELRGLAIDVANEASLVAELQGVQLRGVEDAVVSTANASAGNRSSMLQDVDAGRPTEADAIYGEIQRAAMEKGAATPLIDALSALIDARTRFTVTKEESREQYARRGTA